MLVNNRMAGENPRLTRDSGAGGEKKDTIKPWGLRVCTYTSMNTKLVVFFFCTPKQHTWNTTLMHKQGTSRPVSSDSEQGSNPCTRLLEGGPSACDVSGLRSPTVVSPNVASSKSRHQDIKYYM